MATPAGGPRRRHLLQLGAAGLVSLITGCTRATPEHAVASASQGSPTAVRRPDLAALSAQLTSPLLLPGAAGYDSTARLYNPRFDASAQPAAIARCASAVAPGDTAFVHRRALATVQYTATWDGAGVPDPYDAYVRRQRADLLPWTGPSAYVNYADPAIADSATAYWGANVDRLRAVKRR